MDAETAEKKKEIIKICMEKDVLLPMDVLNNTSNENINRIHYNLSSNQITPEETISILESKKATSSVQVIRDYKEESNKKTVQDFVAHFRQRYKSIELILKQRTEFRNVISIRRIPHKMDGDSVSIIGFVYEKSQTKKGNILLTLEDLTGFFKVLVNQNNSELYAIAKDLVHDEIIGVVGKKKESLLFAETIKSPDIPVRPLKKSPDEAYACVITDIEFGSSIFLEEEFNNFLLWIRGEKGSEKHRQMAKKTKYIFVAGDVVAGVGVYPSQEKELAVKDIYEQYRIAAESLAKIPSDKHIILCAGNHDAARIAEPQPALDNEYAAILKTIPNLTLVSNPSLVRIHENEFFSGFDVLIYHGYSYSYYADNVSSIRESDIPISDRTDLIMKYLLQKRHLAPTYKSNLFIPSKLKDHLVIEYIPDIFISGHIHKFRTATYRNIMLICGSCWSPQTDFQEKMGHIPEPCKVPLIHLHDRKVTVLNFQK